MFRDLGLVGDEEGDPTRDGPPHIGPETVFGTLSETSEPFSMGDGIWSVLIFAVGDSSTAGSTDCRSEGGNSGVVGVEGDSVTGSCIGGGGSSVTSYSLVVVSRTAGTFSSLVSLTAEGEFLLCESWQRAE